MSKIMETDLYAPVKALLQSQGYEVKGEVGAVDIMACRGDEEPVLVELKTSFSLVLILQGVQRQAVTDLVYLAVPGPKKRATRDHVALCRRLGLGLMLVRLRDGFVEVLCDPGPYAPRKSKPQKAHLLREFQRRVGDPNKGGSRGGRITAYRQDALRCATFLADTEPCKGADVAKATGVTHATRMMRDNHYGWFDRIGKGTYALSEAGRAGLAEYGAVTPVSEINSTD